MLGVVVNNVRPYYACTACIISTMAKTGAPDCFPVAFRVINPKSISMNELYGAYDLQTMEWTDGILSSVFRCVHADVCGCTCVLAGLFVCAHAYYCVFRLCVVTLRGECMTG